MYKYIYIWLGHSTLDTPVPVRSLKLIKVGYVSTWMGDRLVLSKLSQYGFWRDHYRCTTGIPCHERPCHSHGFLGGLCELSSLKLSGCQKEVEVLFRHRICHGRTHGYCLYKILPSWGKKSSEHTLFVKNSLLVVNMCWSNQAI